MGQESVYKDFSNIEFEEIVIENDDELHTRDNIEIFHEDEEGIIWMALNLGLFRYNGHTAINVSKYLFKTYNIDLSLHMSTQVLTDKNSIWYGTRKGLYKIDKSGPSAVEVILDEPLHSDNYRNFITYLQIIGDTLYVGTANGLYIINKNSNKVLKKYLNNGLDINRRYSTNVVQAIYPNIEDGVIWAALNSGLYRINKLSGHIEQYTINNLTYPGHHFFYEGQLYDDVLLSPTYGNGMVKFNMKTKEFSRVETNTSKGSGFEYNIIRSAVKLNDSISLVNLEKLGNALFNRKTNKFQWLETPNDMKGGVFLDLDRNGYVWSSKFGHIFRSTKPVVSNKLPFKHIVDITNFNANGILKNRPAIDGYSLINLEEKEQNVHLQFSISKPYILDSVKYEYRLDSENWKPITTPNNLKLFGLSFGNHQINIKALDMNRNILAQRVLNFNIYQPFYKSFYFIAISFLALLTGIYLLGRYRNTQKMKVEKLRNDYEMQLSKLESEALRSQINPHFIFNTLNSIKFYAVKKSKDETKDFITKFSTLIRQVLENSKKNLIPFGDELKTIESYVGIEKLRFNESFNYSIDVGKKIDPNFLIAPMVIQPFIENAIWHGLLHKDGDRKLSIKFKQLNLTLTCEIEDNGIGRKAAQEISKNKPHKSSLGMAITKDRLEQFKTLFNLKSTFDVIDLYADSGEAIGTKVIIQFKKMN